MNFKYLQEPKFKIYQQVWVLTEDAQLWQDKVQRLFVILFEDEGEIYGVLKGYVLSCVNMTDPNDLYEESVLYATKEEAIANAKWYPVSLTPEEWQEAQLEDCCNQVYAINFLLEKCQELGGFTEYYRQKLQKMLNNHGESTASTQKLLAQLEIYDS